MDDERKRSVFVGNLTPQATEALLHELFIQIGPVERVSIPKPKEGNSTAGYGFVTFRHEMSAPYSVDVLRGTCLFGRPLNVKLRTPAGGATPPVPARQYQEQRPPRQERRPQENSYYEAEPYQQDDLRPRHRQREDHRRRPYPQQQQQQYPQHQQQYTHHQQPRHYQQQRNHSQQRHNRNRR